MQDHKPISGENQRPYLHRIVQSVLNFPLADIDRAFCALWDAYERGAQVFTLGNGGSAATAIHFAGDLNKTTITDPTARRFKARSLAENISQLTAWANDVSYDLVFQEQLVNFLQERDVVFAISGSGNSPNVIKAVEYAKEKGALTIGLCGFSGGRLGQLADIPIICRNDDMLQVEDLHSIVCHYLTWELREKIRRAD